MKNTLENQLTPPFDDKKGTRKVKGDHRTQDKAYTKTELEKKQNALAFDNAVWFSKINNWIYVLIILIILAVTTTYTIRHIYNIWKSEGIVDRDLIWIWHTFLVVFATLSIERFFKK